MQYEGYEGYEAKAMKARKAMKAMKAMVAMVAMTRAGGMATGAIGYDGYGSGRSYRYRSYVYGKREAETYVTLFLCNNNSQRPLLRAKLFMGVTPPRLQFLPMFVPL